MPAALRPRYIRLPKLKNSTPPNFRKDTPRHNSAVSSRLVFSLLQVVLQQAPDAAPRHSDPDHAVSLRVIHGLLRAAAREVLWPALNAALRRTVQFAEARFAGLRATKTIDATKRSASESLR